jgi:hypothetical protein
MPVQGRRWAEVSPSDDGEGRLFGRPRPFALNASAGRPSSFSPPHLPPSCGPLTDWRPNAWRPTPSRQTVSPPTAWQGTVSRLIVSPLTVWQTSGRPRRICGSAFSPCFVRPSVSDLSNPRFSHVGRRCAANSSRPFLPREHPYLQRRQPTFRTRRVLPPCPRPGAARRRARFLPSPTPASAGCHLRRRHPGTNRQP